LGGQFVELYARLHPEEVAGVVLVDARSVDFSQRCLAERVERCTLPWLSRILLPPGARAELAGAARTEEQIRAAGPFPAVPLHVLTATQRPASMPNLRRVWAETQAALSQLSPRGEQEICESCGHFIQRDAPERVIEAIRSIVASTRE
ncbi:MAG TPA: alpha/beta hydrolase, partial [Myxococcota bacterium]|nr:alpha/beta hydrolase [Myxococcota bacterium]